MQKSLQLAWHQFRKETREHRGFLIGYGILIGVFTVLGATSLLETAVDGWGRPWLMDNDDYYLFITLLPALFFTPFLAFADSTHEPEAFWLTKPVSAFTVVGGKFLWLGVWLIALPLLGECLVITALGGMGKLPYIAFDYIYLRAAFLLPVFALATLANHPLKLLLGGIGIPLVMETVSAFLQVIAGDPAHPAHQVQPYAESVALSQLWIGITAVGAVAVAWAQYRWRRAARVGLPLALAVVTLAVWIETWRVDLTQPKSIPASSPFSAVRLQLNNARIEPGALTVEGVGRAVLHADAVLTGLPPIGAMGLVRMELRITAGNRESRLVFSPGQQAHWNDSGEDKQRIFANLIRGLKGERPATNGVLHAVVEIPLDTDFPGTSVPQVTGSAEFDCFTYEEFARLRPAPYDGSTYPPNNVRVQSSVEREGTRLTLSWPVAPGATRQFSIQDRHLSSTLDPDNPEPWTKSHLNVARWMYLTRDTRSQSYWESYTDQYSEYCQAAARCALHLNSGWVNLPSSFPADEIVVFTARMLGRTKVVIEAPTPATP